MTQDEILMELRQIVATTNHFTTWTVSTPHLVALVKLAIDREREACAELADMAVDFWVKGGFPECAEVREAMNIGESIRARGQA